MKKALNVSIFIVSITRQYKNDEDIQSFQSWKLIFRHKRKEIYQIWSGKKLSISEARPQEAMPLSGLGRAKHKKAMDLHPMGNAYLFLCLKGQWACLRNQEVAHDKKQGDAYC